MSNNPIHDILRDEVVKPALNAISRECDGMVSYVNYMEQTLDITYIDHQGREMSSRNAPMPKDGDGIFREAIKIGDRVKIGFVNGSHLTPYISIVYKNNSGVQDYKANHGAGIMKGISYLLGSD